MLRGLSPQGVASMRNAVHGVELCFFLGMFEKAGGFDASVPEEASGLVAHKLRS
jgi:hypothetical protein